MILEVQHETRLEYTEPVTESTTELRMEPASDSEQSCRSFHLSVVPHAELFRYQDGFANRVHHFNLLSTLSEVRILAASIVETHEKQYDWATSQARYPLDIDCNLEVLDFLQFRGPVRPTHRLDPYLDALRPNPGQRLVDILTQVSAYIRSHFEYARYVTLASSPIDDLLAQGKGVCQDFTHLMIALLRSFNMPARYVSGYIHRPGKESQSHAWCEAWLPDLGWIGIDPTNDRFVDDHFVKVAVGRDFTDVPPNKGIYRGKGAEKISVRVETRELSRLPSMSWQEQLPILQVPLQTIASAVRYDTQVAPELQGQQ